MTTTPPPAQSQPPRHRPWRAFWIVLLIVLAAALLWWLHARPAPAPKRGRFALSGPMPVVAVKAAKGDIGITFSGLGTVTPLAMVTVRTQIAGQLMRLDFHEGQMVQKGQLLAEIDDRPYLLTLSQAEGALLRDQALLKNAKLDLGRYKLLASQNSIARQQLDTQAALVIQDEGTVKSDEAAIATAKLDIAYCHITAPITGRAGLRQVDPGNYVQTSDANGIVVLTQMAPTSVLFSLPEDDLPLILKRLKSGARLPVTAYDRSGTVKLAQGMFATLDNQIDTSTGTIKLRADFSNAEGTLFPNQFVNVTLEADVLKNTTIVPEAAIQRGAPGTFVYIVQGQDTASVRKVTLGPAQGLKVAILSGLSPGDLVVIDGADKLREGAKVSLRQEAASNPVAPAAAATKPPAGRAAADPASRKPAP